MEMKKLKKLIVASVGGACILSGVAQANNSISENIGTLLVTNTAEAACKAKNACKGKGGCKTDTHSCKGHNSCKGQGGCKSRPMLAKTMQNKREFIS